MIIRRSTLNQQLQDARNAGYDARDNEPPRVYVHAADISAATAAARRLLHPNGDRGRATLIVKRQDIQGDRGGILITGWGANEQVLDEARRQNMLIIETST